jgi:hypothetical protein
MPRFVALTGLPRSGSTLCCHLVGQSPDAVALVEPMDVMALDGENLACAAEQVVGFFDRTAERLRHQRLAPSVHRGGGLPDNPYGSGRGGDGLRERVVSEVDEVRFEKPLSSGFLLLVKHNAAFAALLPTLSARMEVFALVRNPLAVLCSWQTVPIPPQQGHALAAEHLDPVLRRRLADEPERLERQMILLDWFFSRYRDNVPPARQLRYEDVVSSHGASLWRALGVPPPAEVRPMAERNANRAYAGVDVDRLAARLLDADGAWREWYSREDIGGLVRRLGEWP